MIPRKKIFRYIQVRVLVVFVIASFGSAHAYAAPSQNFFGPVRDGTLNFTSFPEYIGLGMTGATENKRELALAMVKVLSVFAGLEVRNQSDLRVREHFTFEPVPDVWSKSGHALHAYRLVPSAYPE